MRVQITRDSVCAADDVDPRANARQFVVEDGIVDQLVQRVWRAAELPTIAGGRATWCISSAIPLAVVAQQWAAPKLIGCIPPQIGELDVRDGTIYFHLSYFAQEDPELVYNILCRLTLRSR